MSTPPPPAVPFCSQAPPGLLPPEPILPSAGGLVNLETSICIVHADSDLLVLNKPAGLLSVPGRGPDKQDCLSAQVQAVYPDALVVHRLDQATSGLLVMARSLAAQRTLSLAFEQREVVKTYIAVVHGLPAQDRGSIHAPLGADWPQRPRQKVDPKRGKPAHTDWSVLQRDPVRNTSRLLLQPHTGRTHQLRVHLQWLGHPIVGDRLYGLESGPRMLLHAHRIGLAHPGSGLRCAFESGVPF